MDNRPVALKVGCLVERKEMLKVLTLVDSKVAVTVDWWAALLDAWWASSTTVTKVS